MRRAATRTTAFAPVVGLVGGSSPVHGAGGAWVRPLLRGAAAGTRPLRSYGPSLHVTPAAAGGGERTSSLRASALLTRRILAERSPRGEYDFYLSAGRSPLFTSSACGPCATRAVVPAGVSVRARGRDGSAAAAGARMGEQRRGMGFWAEFVKSFKERAENSKELNESIAELKKLQEAESIKKTKESVEKLKDKSAEGLSHLKNISEKAAAKGGEVTSRISDSMASTLDDLSNRTNIGEKVGKTMEGLDKVTGKLDRAREEWEEVETRLEGQVRQFLTDKIPFLGQDPSASATKQANENGELQAPATATAPALAQASASIARSPLAVGIQEAKTRFGKQVRRFRDTVRATGAFKKAVALREKIVESDNPLIQRTLDLGDNVSRATSKLFAENDHAKTIKLLHTMDSSFSTERFKREMASSFVPKLRSALLSGEPGPITSLMSKRLAEHELEVFKEWESHGYKSHSKLLNLDSVEILNAQTREDGRPTLLIHFVSQENHCMRDRTGAVIEGAVDNIQDVEQTWALHYTEDGRWEVTEYAVISARPSW